MTEAIRFYCGVDDSRWNKQNVSLGNYLFVSPINGRKEGITRVTRPDIWWNPEEIIIDSGAFSDSLSRRVSYSDARDRQLNHAKKFNYYDFVSHIVSYDVLIDEHWSDGERKKKRWNKEDAKFAICETIKSAEWLSNNRIDGIDLVLSCQGVDIDDYMFCAKNLIGLFHEGDIFGTGGWCIIGKNKTLFPTFSSLCDELIPFLSKNGIKRVHIFGVLYARALGKLLSVCDRNEIKLSTDSSSAHRLPISGFWGYADKRKKYIKPKTNDEMRIVRAKHANETANWLANFRETIWYE